MQVSKIQRLLWPQLLIYIILHFFFFFFCKKLCTVMYTQKYSKTIFNMGALTTSNSANYKAKTYNIIPLKSNRTMHASGRLGHLCCRWWACKKLLTSVQGILHSYIVAALYINNIMQKGISSAVYIDIISDLKLEHLCVFGNFFAMWSQ